MDNRTHSSLPPLIVPQRFRALLLLLLAAEMIGVGAELLLMSHWEDWWQRTPLIVLAVGLIVLPGQVMWQNRASLRAFQLRNLEIERPGASWR